MEADDGRAELTQAQSPDVSVVIAAYNEEENVHPLIEGLSEALKGLRYEIIVVDDCSTDGTYGELTSIKDTRLRVIRLSARCGQSNALYEGFQAAASPTIATLDADLQNNPEDILLGLEELGRGSRFVCGWRKDRQDDVVRKISTRIGNAFNNLVLGVGLHDNNCPLKVFRKECIEGILYFPNFHRFYPYLVKRKGVRLDEIVVRHYPRRHGAAKYGVRNRLFTNLATVMKIRLNPGRYMDGP